VWPLLAERPRALLAVVDDYAYVPTGWQAAPGTPPELGVPTSYYATVQLSCDVRIVDDPAGKAAILSAQLRHHQPEGGYAEPAPGADHVRRLLPGIRGLELTVTAVRAKFKYGGNKPPEHRELLAGHLAERAGPGDAAARAHLLRRHAATRPAEPG
jgi:transcriptional regulator